jgi:hypothetical protein
MQLIKYDMGLKMNELFITCVIKKIIFWVSKLKIHWINFIINFFATRMMTHGTLWNVH